MTLPCPICEFRSTRVFFETAQLPTFIGVQWPTPEAARSCAQGGLRLRFCSRCGFIWNDRFDPGLLAYSQSYDNSLDFSAVFQAYARALASRLIETYEIRGKEVVEIGCGKGHFLTLLCEMGGNRGTGFDPSYEGDRVPSTCPERMVYVRDVYGERYTGQRGDLVCCRHVFEHIQSPMPFLANVRATMGDQPNAVVYFEVPNVRFILEQFSVWDVIYEHCSYFSRESLAEAFRRGGFQVLQLQEVYDRQFLGLDARLAGSTRGSEVGASADLAGLTSAVERFSEVCARRRADWMSRLEDWRRGKRRCVVWGAGAKAVSFLNLLQIRDEIPFAVDINPHKQGKHLPGTGQRIVAPEFLREYRPDVVVLMNPIYCAEVERQLSSLGLQPQIIPA